MATNNTQEELKRQALRNLDASRAEIVAGIRQLRSDLSPKLILQGLVDRHTGSVVGIAVATGVASSLLMLRRTHSTRLDHQPKPWITEQSVRRPTIGARMLRVLAGSLLPALLKSGVGLVLRAHSTR